MYMTSARSLWCFLVHSKPPVPCRCGAPCVLPMTCAPPPPPAGVLLFSPLRICYRRCYMFTPWTSRVSTALFTGLSYQPRDG